MNTTMNEQQTNNDNRKVMNNNVQTENSNHYDNDSQLTEFFSQQLKDIYWAEQALIKTLPKMKDAATSRDLKHAFDTHLQQTKQQVERLETVFGNLGVKPEAVTCQAMAGIVNEGEDMLKNAGNHTAQRDVGLIFAGQKAGHYEIATYGGLVTLAKTLGFYDSAELLNQTLEEEKNADNRLTQIATQQVNRKASQEPSKA